MAYGSVNVPGVSKAELDAVKKSVDELRMFVLSITFSASMKDKPFTVTGEGMATYNGIVAKTLVATVAVPSADTTYTITCAGYSKTITTGGYYGIYSAYVDNISNTLAANSWAQIATVAAEGNAENYWQVGDEIDMVVDGETLTFQIYGFNHDNLTGGGKAGITFGMKNLMTEVRSINPTATNEGGFTGSTMYDWLNNTLFPTLPEELRGHIKSVDKQTSSGQQSAIINRESMKLFLFSPTETGLGSKDEGETYPIFTNNASRIKRKANGTGGASTWWERSPSAANSTAFYSVNSNGLSGTLAANTSCGVCFGFCV